MDAVFVACVECDASLGSVFNLWNRIGKRHLTPAIFRPEDLQLFLSGPVRPGVEDTLVTECMLQDADCPSCKAYLGQSCAKSPLNHIVQESQPIFRASSISLRSTPKDGDKVEPIIKKSLNLKTEVASPAEQGAAASPASTQESAEDFNFWGGSLSASEDDESIDISQLQADIDTQREELNRLSATGFQAVSSFEGAIRRVEQKVHRQAETIDGVEKNGQNLQEEVSQLRAQISRMEQAQVEPAVLSGLDQRIQATVQSLDETRSAVAELGSLRDDWTKMQQELRETQKENADLRLQLEELRSMTDEGFAASRESASVMTSDISSLQQELQKMLADIERERVNSPTPHNFAVLFHELDLLSRNVSRVGNRANQIESLQMDVELFRIRLQRLEGLNRSQPANQDSVHGKTIGGEDELSLEQTSGNIARKRPFPETDDDEFLGATPPKQRALMSDGSNASSHASSSVTESSPASSTETRRRSRRVRLGVIAGNATNQST